MMYQPVIENLMKITFADLLDQKARQYPEHDCLIVPHAGIRYTYAQFLVKVEQAAKGLLAMGVKKGDKVSIWATNIPQWLITFFATAKIGAISVTVNTNYKQFELEYLLRQSDTTTLVMIDRFKDSDYIAHIQGIVPELDEIEPGTIQSRKLPFLKNVIFVGDREKKLKGMYHFDDLYEMGKTVKDEELTAAQKAQDVDDVIQMQYTSGTTGFPKGVQLTHYNIINNGGSIGDCMHFTPEDKLCIVVPLFHCFGMVLAVTACLTHACTMVLVDVFSPLKVMEALSWEKCTAVHGVPTMFISMLEHPQFSSFDFSHMRTGIMAGSPCPTAFMRRAIDEMHMRDITITYGQTECSPGMTMTTVNDTLEQRVHTVGKLLPFVEGKIINPETGEEVPVNTPGEIVTRGYHVMKGYYKMAEATRQAVDQEGWLHTGDIGTMDENGYFKITGRLKDMIIRGGENIYPREIEEFIYTHPAVNDVQVVGVPDRRYGEEVMAFVILNNGMTLTEEELIQFVKNGLSRYKAPRYVRFVETFPMTASGKIQKFVLREMAVELLDKHEDAHIETA